VATDPNSIRLRNFLHAKIAKRKKHFLLAPFSKEYESFQQKIYTIAVRKSKKEERFIV
jgi:hypothetical protein